MIEKIKAWAQDQEERKRARKTKYKALSTRGKINHHLPLLVGASCIGIGFLAGEIMVGISSGWVLGSLLSFLRSKKRTLAYIASSIIGLAVPSGLAFYGSTYAFGLWGLQSEVQRAFEQKELLDDHREEVASKVQTLIENFEAGYVQVMRVESELSDQKPISEMDGPLSTALFAWQIGGAADALPEELGKDPILPMRSIIRAKDAMVLLDHAGGYLQIQKDRKELAEQLGKDPSDLTTEDYLQEMPQKPSYLLSLDCMVGGDGEVIRMTSMPDFYLLDLTEDPTFAPLKRVCLEAIEKESWSYEKYEHIKAEIKAEFGPLE